MSRKITMFKKATLPLTAGLLALSGATYAAPIAQDIQVNATVQAAGFYIKPQTGWPTSPVQITYDPTAKKFSAHTMVLRVMNTTANVSAALAYPATVRDPSSASAIDLDVLIDQQKLTTVPATFHNLGASEKTYLLSISSSAATPAAGNYEGSVSLVFDAVSPPPPPGP
jgi:CS1 type fimbrial major subunit